MEDPALTFALTLKRWFKANGWPQKITDDWAKDPGVNYPHGPWASQICGAMKADGYNPRADFFIAMAVFNKAVAEQSLRSIQGQQLKKRLEGSKPLTHDDGRLFTPTDFWGLFAGQVEPPSAYATNPALFSQEDADAWTAAMRDSFRQVSLKHMCSRAEAWQLFKDKLCEIGDRHKLFFSPDDFTWVQEVFAGFTDPEAEALIHMGKRWNGIQPLMMAFDELLGPDFTKKPLPAA